MHRLLLALALVTMQVAPSAAEAPRLALSTVDVPVTGLTVDYRISGPLALIASGSDTFPPDTQLYDSRNASLRPLCSGCTGEDIFGAEYLVHLTTGELQVRNVAGGTPITITSSPDVPTARLSGRAVAWLTFVPGSFTEGFVVDRATGRRRTLDRTWSIDDVAVAGSHVAWTDRPAFGEPGLLRLLNLDTGVTTTISTRAGRGVDLDAAHLVFSELDAPGARAGLTVTDLAGRRVARSATGFTYEARISGEWVAIVVGIYDGEKLGLWHWTTGDVYFPPGAQGGDLDPFFIDLDGQRVVWGDGRPRVTTFAISSGTQDVSFADAFDTCTSTADLGPNWTVSGRWYCQSGRARGESAIGLALANAPATSETDATGLVQLNGSTGSGVVARASATSYYAARLLVNRGVQIVRVNGSTTTVLGEVPVAIANATSYTLHLRVSGDASVQLSVDLNGQALFTATDTSSARLASGRAGLLSGASFRTQFDNFLWKGLVPGGTGGLAPSAFVDGFDSCTATSGLGPRWVTNGTWSCSGQRARGESTLGTATIDVPVFGTTAVSALVQLNAGASGSGLFLRRQGASFYGARVLATGRLQIIRVEGTTITVLAETPVTVPVDASRLLRFSAGPQSVFDDNGPFTLVALYDQRASVRFEDTSSLRLAFGQAGLLSGGGRTQFEDVVLSGEEDFLPPGPFDIAISENFDACRDDDPPANLSVVAGRWYCRSGRVRGESAGGLAAFQTFPFLQDTDVSALVQLNGSTNSGVVARLDLSRDVAPYYAARLVRTGRVEIVRVTGGEALVLGIAPLAIIDDHSYSMRLQVTGTAPVKLTLTVDGNSLVVAQDTSAQRIFAGDAGLLSGSNVRSQYDNFVLRGRTQ